MKPGEIGVLRDATRILFSIAGQHTDRDARHDADQAMHAIYGLLDRLEILEADVPEEAL